MNTIMLSREDNYNNNTGVYWCEGRMFRCRDFRLLSIGGGADEVMLSIIAKEMNIFPTSKPVKPPMRTGPWANQIVCYNSIYSYSPNPPVNESIFCNETHI